MKLKSILVDDSSIQRRAVAQLINQHPRLSLMGEYSNALEAKRALKQYDIDLIFLDVEMPIISGFDLLEALENPPQIILITGKSEYALKAFDYNVTDYLYKPITPDRFDAAIQKAIARSGQLTDGEENEDEPYIFVKSNFKKQKVFLHNIKWVEALGDYVKIVTPTANLVVLSTMKGFEEQLPTDKFLRIHKSYIVNLEKIAKYNSKNVEIEGKQIPLSRNKKTALAKALDAV